MTMVVSVCAQAQAYGNPLDHYGDLDLEMSRKKLDQIGAIKQLLG